MQSSKITRKAVLLGMCGALIATGLVFGLTQDSPLALLIGAIEFTAITLLATLLQTGKTSAVQPLAIEPCVIWFTGLPSSGKTTLSLALKKIFEAQGIKIEHLDGDVVRSVLPGTGFSKADRNDHIRRMGFLSSRLETQGVPVIASFVSPYRESRDFARKLCKNFIEVHLTTSIDECTKRDVKGLYKEAQSGQRAGMTGIDDPYEVPLTPELTLDTSVQTIQQSVQQIINFMLERGLLRDKNETLTLDQNYGSYIAA